MKTNEIVSTRVTKGSAAINTSLTIDWEGMTPEIYQAFATQAIKVKLQSNWRENGIPSEHTVKAVDIAPGRRIAPVMTPEQAMQVVINDPQQRARMLAELLAMQEAESKDVPQ